MGLYREGSLLLFSLTFILNVFTIYYYSFLHCIFKLHTMVATREGTNTLLCCCNDIDNNHFTDPNAYPGNFFCVIFNIER